jgi:hydrogenase maturation protein HypF
VALSGGCFQNRILLEGTVAELKKNGFEVYSHSHIPANDGGVSLGQAVIAGSIVKKGQ